MFLEEQRAREERTKMMERIGVPRCGTREGAQFWLNVDCCGLLCAAITYCLLVYSQYVITTCLGLGQSSWGRFHIMCFNSLSLLSCYVHFRTMVGDPGAVPKSAEGVSRAGLDVEAQGGGDTSTEGIIAAEDQPPKPRMCKKCRAFKPVRAHHCSICQRCIVKMDHHCPWVNNCVGVGNHKFFLLFIMYVFVQCAYAIALVVTRFLVCLRGRFRDDNCIDPQRNLLVVFLLVESFLFGLFTMCMFMDQWQVVTSNQTQIDRLQGLHFPGVEHVNEVFGGSSKKFRLRWLIPNKVYFAPNLRDVILGYRTTLQRAGGGKGDDDGGAGVGGVGGGGESSRSGVCPSIPKLSTDPASALSGGSVRERKPRLAAGVAGLFDEQQQSGIRMADLGGKRALLSGGLGVV